MQRPNAVCNRFQFVLLAVVLLQDVQSDPDLAAGLHDGSDIQVAASHRHGLPHDLSALPIHAQRVVLQMHVLASPREIAQLFLRREARGRQPVNVRLHGQRWRFPQQPFHREAPFQTHPFIVVEVVNQSQSIRAERLGLRLYRPRIGDGLLPRGGLTAAHHAHANLPRAQRVRRAKQLVPPREQIRVQAGKGVGPKTGRLQLPSKLFRGPVGGHGGLNPLKAHLRERAQGSPGLLGRRHAFSERIRLYTDLAHRSITASGYSVCPGSKGAGRAQRVVI